MNRLVGFLTMQAIALIVGSLLPAAFMRDHGGWLIGAWFVAVLWWIAKSGPREWHECEQLEDERKAQRTSQR